MQEESLQILRCIEGSTGNTQYSDIVKVRELGRRLKQATPNPYRALCTRASGRRGTDITACSHCVGALIFTLKVLFDIQLYNILYDSGSGCRLELMPVLASTVILSSESRGITRPYFTLSDSILPTTWRGRSPYLYASETRVARLYPLALVSLFVASYHSQG
jgi:hypothetical protein